MKCFTRIFAVILVLLFSLTGCGGTASTSDPTMPATTPSTAATTALPSTGWITADSLRVFGGPGLSFEIIGGITAGEQVEITGKTGDWYHIRFGETVGYVSGQYLTFTQPTT